MLLNRFVDVNGVEARNVKTREPHIHDYRNLEVGAFLFEKTVQFLAGILVAEQVVKILLIVLTAGHDHLDFFDRLQFPLFLVGKFGRLACKFRIVANFRHAPFRAQFQNILIQCIRNLAAVTNEHRLAANRRFLLNAGLIMRHEILRHGFQSVWVAKNHAHLGHILLALVNLVFVGTRFCGFFVILFNLFENGIVQHHLGGTAFVNDGYRNAVLHRFGHGVNIDLGAKHIEGRVNRRSRKAHVCRIGQGIVQVARKTKTRLDALIGHGNFLVQVRLRTVRFVRNADNIIAVGQQFNIFAELLDGREEHATAFAALQFFTQVGTTLHAFDTLVTDILLGCRKQSRKLVIQIGAVGNQHNRRRLK